MRIVLNILESGKTQALNNVISLSELENIIQIKTTKEKFKIDKNKVSISVFIESSNTSNRDKLMGDLDKMMDELLELQKQNKINNALDNIEKIKNYIKKYEGVEEKDKQELIKGIDMMLLEISLRKKLGR